MSSCSRISAQALLQSDQEMAQLIASRSSKAGTAGGSERASQEAAKDHSVPAMIEVITAFLLVLSISVSWLTPLTLRWLGVPQAAVDACLPVGRALLGLS
jgi:hypothetical protein